MRQPEGLVYAILDARVNDVENWRIAVRSRVEPIRADSVAELATKLQLPAETFAETLAAYNAACQRDGAFDIMTTDGVCQHDEGVWQGFLDEIA